MCPLVWDFMAAGGSSRAGDPPCTAARLASRDVKDANGTTVRSFADEKWLEYFFLLFSLSLQGRFENYRDLFPVESTANLTYNLSHGRERKSNGMKKEWRRDAAQPVACSLDFRVLFRSLCFSRGLARNE